MQRTLLWKIALIGFVALLLGAILVFAALAATMVATRRVDWYAIGVNPPAPVPPTPQKSA